MEEIDNGVVLGDTLAVEMLPNRACQLVLHLTSKFLFPCYRRRKEPDAPGLCQDPGTVVTRVGGGCGEVVFAAVTVQEVSIERVPLNLDAIAVRNWIASCAQRD